MQPTRAYFATLPFLTVCRVWHMLSNLRSGRILCLIGVLTIFSLCPLIPQAAQADGAPLTGFGFLQLEPSARAAALGGSLGAVYGDDVNVLFYNPALMNEEQHGSFSISYLNYLYDVNAGFLAYSRTMPTLGTVAVGLRFMTWGDVSERDAQGVETGTFGASDVALTAGIARSAGERLRYGANVHFVRSSIAEYNATALAGDAGVAYHIADQGLTFSASVNNLGRAMNSFGDVDDELPLDVRVAVSKRLQHVPLFLSLTAYNLHRPNDVPDDLGAVANVFQFVLLGAEFRFSEAFQVRLGYNHRRLEELKTDSRLDQAGFGAGFGIRLAAVNVDYAFSSWSAAGGLHQFTVRTKI